MMFNGQQIPSGLAEAVPDGCRDIIRRSCRECDKDIWSVYDERYNHELYNSDGTQGELTFLTDGGDNIQVIQHIFDGGGRFICGDCHMDVLDTAHRRWITQKQELTIGWRQSGDYIIPEPLSSQTSTYEISEVDRIVLGYRDPFDGYIMIDTPRVAYQQAGTPLYPDINSYVTPEKSIIHESDALEFKYKYNVDLPQNWVMPNTLSAF